MKTKIKTLLKNFYKLQLTSAKKHYLKIIPNTKNILGIYKPKIDLFIKKLTIADKQLIINNLEPKFLEESLLFISIINKMDDIDSVLNYLPKYLLYANNWCLTDAFNYKLKNNLEKTKLWTYIKQHYFVSNQTYHLRLAIVIIIQNFICHEYLPQVFEFISSIKNNDYYCEMAIAWLISTIYFYDKKLTLKFLVNQNISKFVFKKSLQKILESNKSTNDDVYIIKKIKANTFI